MTGAYLKAVEKVHKPIQSVASITPTSSLKSIVSMASLVYMQIIDVSTYDYDLWRYLYDMIITSLLHVATDW